MTRIQNQTGPEEEFSNGAGRACLPGQTAVAAHRVVRPAPAQPLPGLAAASRGSVLAQAGATLGIALSGISRNKARTTLTLLGIVIGVASVITAVGIGTGQAAQVNAQISSLGTNLVTVQPGASFSGGVRGAWARPIP
jgi:hypothetical protein